jgi:hypothetical protein
LEEKKELKGRKKLWYQIKPLPLKEWPRPVPVPNQKKEWQRRVEKRRRKLLRYIPETKKKKRKKG